jgi:hypothetical protein
MGWFRKEKYGNTTVTRSDKGVTTSTSSQAGRGMMRTTFTSAPGGKRYKTTTQKAGGWTRITRKKI